MSDFFLFDLKYLNCKQSELDFVCITGRIELEWIKFD